MICWLYVEHIENPPNTQDLDSPLETLKQLPLALKIHMGVGLSVSILIFFVFHYAAKPTPQESVEWYLVPWFLFGMSMTGMKCTQSVLICSGHFFYLKKEYWKGTVIILVLLHVGLYILNKTFTPEFDW